MFKTHIRAHEEIINNEHWYSDQPPSLGQSFTAKKTAERQQEVVQILVRDTRTPFASGQYVQIIVRPGRPKFKANNRQEGTAEENQAAVRGTTATFGTWSVDEGTKMLIVRIDGGMYPNQDGTESKRPVSVSGDELKIHNPATASGMKSDNVWRRAK